MVYSDISMAFQSCIQNAQQNFSIPYLVQSGVITAPSTNPPQWLAVGGVLASAFISCLADDYWSNNPIQPIISNNYTTISQGDNSQFDSVVNLLYDLFGDLASLNDNFSFVEQALKFDLLEILYLNYNNYNAYIQSVNNYKQYIINQFTQLIQPFVQNFIASANAYFQTLQNIQQQGNITINNPGNGNYFYGVIQPNQSVVLYFPNTPIPAGFGVYFTSSGCFNTTNCTPYPFNIAIFYLFGNPSQTYNAIFYDQNNNVVNQMSLSFNAVVVEQRALGITTVLPYVVFEQYSTQQMGSVSVSVNGQNYYIPYSFSVQVSNIPTFVPIVVNLVQNPSNSINLVSSSSVTSYLSIHILAEYYQFLQNVDLEGYAEYLWNYYHNNGVTQQQLYQILSNTVFTVNIPKCDPIEASSEITTLFNIINSLALQNQSSQINVYPVSAYGTFNVNGLGQVSGYVQFNQPVTLTPNQCTNVGGFITTQSGQVYVVPPGQSICNASNFTVVYRPDMYIVNNKCGFVPIPYSLISVSSTPPSAGVVLDLDTSAVFEAGQQYNLQGWFVSSSLDAVDEIDQISFTPNQSFTYIPSSFAYLTIGNQGIQNIGQNVQAEVLAPSSSSSSQPPPQPPPQPQPQLSISPMIIIAGLILGGILIELIRRNRKYG
jgi:hypothetical protein